MTVWSRLPCPSWCGSGRTWWRVTDVRVIVVGVCFNSFDGAKQWLYLWILTAQNHGFLLLLNVLTQGPGHNVDLVLDTVPLSHSSSVLSIKAHGMNFINERQSSMTVSDIAQLFQRTYGTWKSPQRVKWYNKGCAMEVKSGRYVLQTSPRCDIQSTYVRTEAGWGKMDREGVIWR